MRWIWALVLAACGARVNQDRTTGPDGTIDGAAAIALVENVAHADGTLSYPDGDRVDWYEIALPRPGDIDVEVTWRGKRVALELWDDDYVRIAADHPSAEPRRHVRGETLAKHAYVRLYAPGIEDGGAYSLVVRFTPGPPQIDWTNEDIADPPHFPVPDQVIACAVFDAKNPACRGMCNPDAPDDACRVCPSPPDPNHPACQATMPCPNPPDRRIRACMRPRCQGEHCLDIETMLARVIKVDERGDEIEIFIGAGTEQGVTKDWHGVVLVGDSDRALADLAIVRVDKRFTIARAKLTKSQIEANPRIRMSVH
jgi:hypothetical protein